MNAVSRVRARSGFVVAAASALVTAGFAFWDLGRPSFWLDEAATVGVARRSVGQIFATLGNLDAVHGTYYLLMHFWLGLFGTSEFAMRLPSALAMVVAAVGVARIGSRLGGARLGLIAGLLFAINPTVTVYAEEARSEGIVTALAVWSTWLLLVGLESPRRAVWIRYGSCVVGLGLFHMFSLLLVVGHAITVLAQRRRSSAWRDPVARGWLFAVAAAGVLCSPVVLVALTQRDQVGWISTNGWSLLHLADLWAGDRMLVPIVIALLVAGGVVAARALRVVLVPWLLIAPSALLLASFASPVFLTRYLVFTVPAACLLVAAVLDRMLDRRLVGVTVSVAIAAVLLLIGVPQIENTHATVSKYDDLRGEANYLAAHTEPGDGVVYLNSVSRWAALGYPAGAAGLADITEAPGGSAVATNNLRGVDADPSLIVQRLATLHRVWVIGDRYRDLGPSAGERSGLLAAAGFVASGGPGFEFRGRTVTLWLRH